MPDELKPATPPPLPDPPADAVKDYLARLENTDEQADESEIETLRQRLEQEQTRADIAEESRRKTALHAEITRALQLADCTADTWDMSAHYFREQAEYDAESGTWTIAGQSVAQAVPKLLPSACRKAKNVGGSGSAPGMPRRSRRGELARLERDLDNAKARAMRSRADRDLIECERLRKKIAELKAQVN